MIKTHGKWNPKDRNVIFLASNPGTFERMETLPHDWVLFAINDLNSEKDMIKVEEMIDRGIKVVLDSGVFWLTNKHMRSHGITMDEALSLAPSEIDGFDKLWDKYIKVMKRLGSQAWGYMELDQGGAKNKRITRQKLHDLGFNPIPIWHPLNDGMEYFYELADNYDRICMGNIVQANNPTRLRLLHALSEKHRKYPDLWVHLLGMNANEWFHALGADSADASTWLSPVRWGSFPHQSMLDPDLDHMPMDQRSVYASDPTLEVGVNDDTKILTMSALSLSHAQLGWRHYAKRLEEELGLSMYPPLKDGF